MNNKTSGLFIGIFIGGGIALAVFSSLTKDIDQRAYSRGVNDTLIGMWGEPKEISILKEKKDCEEKGGTFHVDIPPGVKMFTSQEEADRWIETHNFKLHMWCTSPTPPDIFNYEIK